MTKEERNRILEQQLELLYENSKAKAMIDSDISSNSVIMLDIVKYLNEEEGNHERKI